VHVYFSGYATRSPEINTGAVISGPEKQLRGAVARRAYIRDLFVCRFGARVEAVPCYAKIGEVGWPAGGGEENVCGFEVAVQDPFFVEVGERTEDVLQKR